MIEAVAMIVGYAPVIVIAIAIMISGRDDYR
jgi:hypothetical protein